MNLDKFVFCNFKGIFTFLPEKNYINICINLRKNLKIHQNFLFQEKKMFVRLKTDKKYLIKILKFPY